MAQKLGFLLRSGSSQPETALSQFLRLHNIHPRENHQPYSLDRSHRLLFRGSPTPKALALTKALTGAFHEAKKMALRRLHTP